MEMKDRIKNLRKSASMSQNTFANYFGIPYRTLSDWERGLRKPSEYLVNLMEYKLTVEGLIKKDDL